MKQTHFSYCEQEDCAEYTFKFFSHCQIHLNPSERLQYDLSNNWNQKTTLSKEDRQTTFQKFQADLKLIAKEKYLLTNLKIILGKIQNNKHQSLLIQKQIDAYVWAQQNIAKDHENSNLMINNKDLYHEFEGQVQTLISNFNRFDHFAHDDLETVLNMLHYLKPDELTQIQQMISID
jgi:hypothetical protein